jgi:hypothetical protein
VKSFSILAVELGTVRTVSDSDGARGTLSERIAKWRTRRASNFPTPKTRTNSVHLHCTTWRRSGSSTVSAVPTVEDPDVMSISVIDTVTERFNGHIMIDFLINDLGLTVLNPYLDKGGGLHAWR